MAEAAPTDWSRFNLIQSIGIHESPMIEPKIVTEFDKLVAKAKEAIEAKAPERPLRNIVTTGEVQFARINPKETSPGKWGISSSITQTDSNGRDFRCVPLPDGTNKRVYTDSVEFLELLEQEAADLIAECKTQIAKSTKDDDLTVVETESSML